MAANSTGKVRSPVAAVLATVSAVIAGSAAIWFSGAGPVETVALLVALLLAIGLLAVRAPAYAFLGALLMFGFEGTIKMRLTVADVSSPLVVGAALIDLALILAVAGLAVEDRGRTLRLLWRGFGLGERLAVGALVAWIVLVVLQIPLGDSLWTAVDGIRLTHFYVIALPAGAIVAAKLPPARLQQALLAVMLVIAAYAAFRGIVGPTENERRFNASRDSNTEILAHARDAGSFTSPVALVSFLVPAFAFAFALACLAARQRLLGTLVFLLAGVGIIASYVRAAVAAVAAAGLALTAIVIAAGGLSLRRKLVSAGLVLVLFGSAYAAVQTAGDVNSFAKDRAESLFRPFSDYSMKMRVKTWRRSLDKVVDEPLGTGPGTVGRATLERQSRVVYTDNSYVKVIQEQGFPGGFVFLFGVFGATILCAVRLTRIGPLERPLGVASLVGWIAFLALCFLGEYIELPGKSLAWTLLGVAAWEAYGRESLSPRTRSAVAAAPPAASAAGAGAL